MDQLAGRCFGCGVPTDGGLVLHGSAEEVTCGLHRLRGCADIEGAAAFVLEVISRTYRWPYGLVPDGPVSLDCYACAACARRAGMVSALRLPGARLPVYETV